MIRLKAFPRFLLAVIVLLAWACAGHAQDNNNIIAAKERILLDPKADPGEKGEATSYLLGAFDGGNSDALGPIRKVLQGDDSAESRANIEPVLRVLAEDSDGIRAGLLELVVAKLSSGNAAIRDAAFKTLASPVNIASDKLNLYQKVILIVQDPKQSDFARIAAARLIGKTGNSAALPTLLNILRKETGLKMEIKIEVVRAMGELKDLAAVAHLISLIDGDNKEFSRVVVDALRQITYHNYGLDRDKWVKFWQDKREQHKPLTRERLLEDFIISLQGALAASALEELEAQKIDKIIEIIDYSGGSINPPSKYGRHYPQLVDVAVKQLLAIKVPDDKFPAVIAKLNQLLLYDNEEVKRTVLVNYFSSSARQHKDSIPVLLARYQDKLDPLRMEALTALKNVVNVVVGGDRSRLAPEMLKQLEDVMIAALSGDHKTRMNAVDILGFGLRSRNALARMAGFLEFKDVPDKGGESRQFRAKICQNMHHILNTNGKVPLPEKDRLALTAILGRSFLRDDHIRHVVALPLGDIGYEKPFKLEDVEYQGATGLLGSWLKPGSPRNVIEGVLKALEQINSPQSEQKVLQALANDKVIPPSEESENPLAVTALNTLKSIGGDASLAQMLQVWIKVETPSISTAAWEVVAGYADRLLQGRHYDHLLRYGDAITKAAGEKPEPKDTTARKAQDRALKAVESALKGLQGEQSRITNELIKQLDPKNAKRKNALKAIREMTGRNHSLRLTLAAGLAGEYAPEIKAEVHKLLVELTGQKDIPANYAAWKDWLEVEKNP